ncbi:flippase [Clostridium perfringens]|uniref:Oligosaccharide flippase family protein n=1 Tax=Clostridium perfringens TaxID=1502 RepID=A0AAW9HWR4_CLOPF|nr:flippase [Clostridium perfringens]MDM0929498.1 flippase [Clostridium perfringens]MDM0952897.1 flippase [Clostridium perfringens]MDU2655312.1 flippase [Clostridium perfringens]MDZ4910161.1 oligosaccharide flippase family protein [Clostridium perfringens]
MSLKKNFLYNAIYQIFMILLPIITVPYVSRVLGPSGVGLYSYTGSYAQYFVLVGMIGVSLYGNRQVAYNKNNKEKLSKEFWNIYGLQFLTTLISFSSYIVIFVIINSSNKIMYLVQSIVVLTTIFDISWFFIGYEDMRSVVFRNTIVKIIGVLSIFIFVRKPEDVIKYAFIMVMSNFIGQIIMWFNIKDKVYKYKPNIKESIKHLKPALSLFISQLAIQIYTLLDKTMLGFMTGVYEVGLYENSQKTIKLSLTLITSLGVVMLPRMSALHSQGKKDEFNKLIYKAFSFVNFMVFPMVLGLIAISNTFSLWFYGESFNGIGFLLKIGSMLMIFIGWSNILGIQVMLPMKKERQFTISVTIGAIVNFILNLFLIKEFQANGTTLASVIAEFSVTATQAYFLKELIDIKSIFKSIIKPLIGSIIMFIALIFIIPMFRIGVFWTLIEVAIGGIIYLVVMYVLKDQFLEEGVNIIKVKFLKR